MAAPFGLQPTKGRAPGPARASYTSWPRS
jgi:hypothetical protein